MKYKQKGVVLMLALIFLQVIAILGIFGLQSVTFITKMSELQWKNYQLSVASESILLRIEHTLMNTLPSCMISVTSPDELIKKPFSWWQSPETCSGEEDLLNYHYVVETLKIDECAKSAQGSEEEGGVSYFRITVLVHDSTNSSRQWVQSVVTSLNNAVRECNDSYHPVSLGRQSWREIG